jgi:hypothetical protein
MKTLLFLPPVLGGSLNQGLDPGLDRSLQVLENCGPTLVLKTSVHKKS